MSRLSYVPHLSHAREGPWHDLFQHDLFITPGNEDLASQIREVRWGQPPMLDSSEAQLVILL